MCRIYVDANSWLSRDEGIKIGQFLKSLYREMLYSNVVRYVILLFFIEIILFFLVKLLLKLKNLNLLVFAWKNPARYMAIKARVSLSIQITVKIPYLIYYRLNNWKVLNFERDCMLVVSRNSLLWSRCLLLILSVFCDIV